MCSHGSSYKNLINDFATVTIHENKRSFIADFQCDKAFVEHERKVESTHSKYPHEHRITLSQNWTRNCTGLPPLPNGLRQRSTRLSLHLFHLTPQRPILCPPYVMHIHLVLPTFFLCLRFRPTDSPRNAQTSLSSRWLEAFEYSWARCSQSTFPPSRSQPMSVRKPISTPKSQIFSTCISCQYSSSDAESKTREGRLVQLSALHS